MDKVGGGADEALSRAAIDRAITSAGEERAAAEAKLASLSKYWERLDDVAEKLAIARRRLRTAPASEAAALLADREPEVKEVLGNFANLEKECQVVGQSITPQLRVRLFNYLRIGRIF